MSRFDRLMVLHTILKDGLVPLFYHNELQVAKKICGVLVGGGCNVLEFTNRGDFAIEVFSSLVKHCRDSYPNLIIGVGSVEDAMSASLYLAHGASFVVGPIFNEETARLCNRRKVAYIPGCGSVNEIALAEELGCEIIKIFPGNAVGGPPFIQAVHGPRPWTRLMPTGGVTATEANLRAWFEAGAACVGMGSKLISKELITSGDFESIKVNTKATLELIAKIRADIKKDV
ncbi:bifunctional 4-hydroxy-2-oxoglutarate aldolase/2-dehydro-3-deoxy-phosphogluconate aldolase [Chloroflexota bacterium]